MKQIRKQLTVGQQCGSFFGATTVGVFLFAILAAQYMPTNAQVIPHPVEFNVAPYYKVGRGPVGIVAADFNGDGKLDLATANSGSGSVSVLSGNGDGSFSPSVEYSVGRNPSSLAVADFNADGKSDLVVANAGDSTVSFLINNGDGTFRATVSYPVGLPPIYVTVANVGAAAGMGIFTVDALRGAPNTVSIVQDQGLGIGITVTNLSFGSYGVGLLLFKVPSFAMADFNGDSRLDVCVTTWSDGSHSSYAVVFLNNEDAALSKPIASESGFSAVGPMAVGDFNNDTKLDLVVGDNGGVTVLTGNGDGTFTRLTNSITSSCARAVRTLGVADINRDGKMDFVAANVTYTSFITNDNFVSVFLGNGDGSFLKLADYSVGTAPASIAIADLNNDGNSDLAIANSADNTVSVLLGNGDGYFGGAASFGINSVFARRTAGDPSVAAGDFNGDGHLDLIIADEFAGKISLLLNNGEGSFKEINPLNHISPVSIGADDFNGDGRLDLAIGSRDPNIVTVMLGNNDGTFNAGNAYSVSNTAFFAIGEFNGDRKKDLLVARLGTNTLSVLLGAGDGTFSPGKDFVVGSIPTVVAIDDFNNDGKSDLAIANYGSGNVSVLLGRGDGSFAEATSLEVGLFPVSIVGGDLNADGKWDMAILSGFENSVRVLLGNGDGTFVTTTNYAVGRSPGALFVGDFNGDGRLDLITANQSDRTMSVLVGNGDGTFAPSVNVNVGISSRTGVVGDFNADGQMDVALCSLWTMSVVLNQTHTALQLTRATNQLRLAWPSFTAGFVLESTTNLFLANGWSRATNASSVIGNERVLAESLGLGSKFYRLRHP